MSHDKFSWRSQEFNLLRLRVAFLQYRHWFHAIEIENQNNLRKTIKKFAWSNYFSVTLRSTHTSPRRRRRRWTLLLRDEDHWQQNARARFFRCVSASASSRLSPSCLLLLLVHVFVSISAFARPYISLSVSLLDARFLDAFVFNVAQQLSGPWRSTKRNSPQNASVRRQRRRQRQQQQQRRVTSVRGTEGGRGRGRWAAKKKYIRRTTKINVLSKYQQQARRVAQAASALVCDRGKGGEGACRGRGRGVPLASCIGYMCSTETVSESVARIEELACGLYSVEAQWAKRRDRLFKKSIMNESWNKKKYIYIGKIMSAVRFKYCIHKWII